LAMALGITRMNRNAHPTISNLRPPTARRGLLRWRANAAPTRTKSAQVTTYGAPICMLARNNWRHLPPARRMAEALASAGRPVEFYFAGRPSDLDEQVAGVTYHCLPLDWRAAGSGAERLRRELAWGARFLRIATRHHVELFYAHNISAVPWVALAAASRHRPWVYQAHEYMTAQDCSSINRIYLELERLLARKASLVLCPEPTRARLMAVEQRLQQMPLVVRNAANVVPVRRNDTLRRWSGATGRLVLYQGGIDATPQMLALVRSVTQWDPGDCLILLGWSSADSRAAIERTASEFGISARVRFHGHVPHEQVWPLVCGADIGLVLYSSANMNERYAAPNKLGEYLMAGLAIVYTRCDGLSDLLGGRSFAREVTEPCASAFATAMQSLTGDTLSMAQRAAREYAESEYAFEVQARPAIAAIERLMDPQ